MTADRPHDHGALWATGALLVASLVLALTGHAVSAVGLAGIGYVLALPALCGGLAMLGSDLLRGDAE